ncbi:MAG: tRNA (adenosine(37)-N6)-threonylcarbamoyltransferase complex transferase subunit TsaD [Candidatus Staskawiczbacteria bacterium]|nr:tRNA (adenosine(37)-N6)-threonylcarbamoyltransferase complex transferase subunit TsaD [Candidatus Staskawiczbacteria bacterium]
MKQKRIIILAVETSCDDTGIAILKAPKTSNFSAYGGPVEGWKVLSNIVSSQVKIHKKYGGVYPMLAKREHQQNLPLVLTKALKESKLLKISNSQFLIPKQIQNPKFKILKKILEREEKLYGKLTQFLAKYKKPEVDLIAVTQGPGLEPCLWVGVNFAKALSLFWDIPIVPINHIEAHILVNFVDSKSQFKIQNSFPAVCLVVSGGHTQLILMKNIGKYKIIGETKDDAAGECFDKCAKILGLGYPGGPAIAAEAAKFQISNFKFQIKLPRPMINTKDYDFSFSGLKTAVLYHHKKQSVKTQKSKEYIMQMCFQTQQAIIDVLLKKTTKAAKDYKAKTIILGGGVSANQELRKQLKEKIEKEIPNTKYLIPNTKYSTDNALMIAITGYFHKTKTKDWKKLKAKANLRIS